MSFYTDTKYNDWCVYLRNVDQCSLFRSLLSKSFVRIGSVHCHRSNPPLPLTSPVFLQKFAEVIFYICESDLCSEELCNFITIGCNRTSGIDLQLCVTFVICHLV